MPRTGARGNSVCPRSASSVPPALDPPRREAVPPGAVQAERSAGRLRHREQPVQSPAACRPACRPAIRPNTAPEVSPVPPG